MRSTVLFISLLTAFNVASQTVTYNDVVVIVNQNSQTSIEVGNYFQAARNIPNQNMILVDAPITEEIDSLQFEFVRAQIEDYLIANDLVDSINYIVTTKGVPLKVESDCFNPNATGQACASFDSELTLILGGLANQIGLSGSWANPVYNTTDSFSRENYGIYLVTRLDGYKKQDIFNLIDRSGPFTILDQISTQGIVDLNAAVSSDSAYFMGNYLQPTYDQLTNNGWNTQLDANFNPLLNQNDVFAYVYGGHGPFTNVILNYDWAEGAIGSMSTCETATTFDVTTNSSNSFLIADIIAEGCTGAYGNVDCIYFSQVLNSQVLMSRYLDTAKNYNLAESFYMAEPRLSWQSVIVGDPKASVLVDNLAATPEVDLGEISIYPNPSTGNVNVSGSDLITAIIVVDMRGATVKSYGQINSSSAELDLNELGDGVYLIQAEIGGSVVRERVVIRK